MFSNIPTCRLIEKAIELEICLHRTHRYGQILLQQPHIDNELESRIPNEASYYFGDCAGQPIFVPIELECDDNGNPILEKMIGYDDKGKEVWI